MGNEQDKIEENIRQLQALEASGAMPNDLAQASIAALRVQLATYNAKLHGDGAIAQGANAKAIGRNSILVEGDFHGSIYKGEDPAEDKKRLAIYRHWIMENTASLPLRGVDVGASDPTGEHKSIGLANIYVDLDTKSSDLEPVEHRKGQKEQGVVMDQSKALLVLKAVRLSRFLVLVGDPGGGKSTFVNFLAHCLAAHGLDPSQNWLEHLPGWPVEETDILPVVVTLRDFARHYSEKLPAVAEPQHLLGFIRKLLQAQNMVFALPALEKALEAGQAIVLLDGLDEVPTQAQRIFVRDVVRVFASRYPKSRFLVTCRVLSYHSPEKGQPDLRLERWPVYEIAPFNNQKIERFISIWYAMLGRMGSVPVADVGTLTKHLHQAVSRPDLQRLAPNPLLLTVMALVHTHRGRLPDARALLYEETMDILLWRWEQIKLGGQEETPRLRQCLLEAGRTDIDLKRILWELAYQAHAASQPDKTGENLADISEHSLLKLLATLKRNEANPSGDLSWAKRLVDLMKLRAGLLLERQPEVFTFPHRTFQEYLAGACLATEGAFPSLAARLARSNLNLWREAILYACGRLVYVSGDTSKPLALVAELCPTQAGDDEFSWQLAWLAGDILCEIGRERAADSTLGREQLERNRNRLKDLLAGGKLTAKERVRAGNTLAALGDPRFEPEHWYLPNEPDLGFVRIPAGKFIMGSDDYYDDEKPQHELDLPYDYWLAKYPVTVAQYRAFVEASNYKTSNTDSLRGISNHPVVLTSWYDAMAYCEWLEEQLLVRSRQLATQEMSPFWQGLADGRLHVTLPSEAEWEKAACGTDRRIYPWGKDFDSDKANTNEAEITTTSPVGAFPGGVSPNGLFDMSGNSFEWTRTIGNDCFGYPYQLGDGREDLKTKDTRILRGGSFILPQDFARCAFRDGFNPSRGDMLDGFRVMVTNL